MVQKGMTDRDAFFSGLKEIELTLTEKQIGQVDAYVDLLKRWNKTHNLVAPSSLKEVYTRHCLDSIQLALHLKPSERVLDIGSGAGLPAALLAIVAPEGVHITACERIHKKTAFLKEVRRKLALQDSFDVRTSGVEEIDAAPFDVITARAVATVEILLDLGLPHLKPSGRFLLLKGESAQQEIDAAKMKYKMTTFSTSSITNARGEVVQMTQITQVSGNNITVPRETT